MDLSLQGKTALVLAGGRGLGAATARCLAREGVAVAVAGLHRESVEQTTTAIEQDGGKAFPLVWDLGDLSVIDAKVSEVEHRFGRVDILVNNTGGPPTAPAAGQDPAVWSSHFRAMVLSVIATTDRVLPGMKAKAWGRVITSTSSGVVQPIANLGLSNALRLSLVGWSKTLAREVAKDGITVNVVVPGRIATERVHAVDQAKANREGKTIPQVVAESAAMIALGRYGRPEEYADMVTFLASERASYVTGAMIRVDGGLIASI